MSFRKEHDKTANDNHAKPEVNKRKKKRVKDVVDILSKVNKQEGVHLQLNRCTGFKHDSFDLDQYVQKIEALRHVYPKLTFTIVAYLNPHDPDKCEAFLKANAKTIEKLGKNFCIDDAWREKNHTAVEAADNSVKEKLNPADAEKFNNLLKERAQEFAKKYEVSVELAITHLRKETIDTLALLQPASENLSKLTILYYDHDLPDVMNFVLGSRTETLGYHRDSFVHAQSFKLPEKIIPIPAKTADSHENSSLTNSESPRSRPTVTPPIQHHSPTLPPKKKDDGWVNSSTTTAGLSSPELGEEKNNLSPPPSPEKKASTPPNNRTPECTPEHTPHAPRRRSSYSLFTSTTSTSAKSKPKTPQDIKKNREILLSFGIQLAKQSIDPNYLVGYLLECVPYVTEDVEDPWNDKGACLPQKQSENVTTTVLISNSQPPVPMFNLPPIPITSTNLGIHQKAPLPALEPQKLEEHLSTSPGGLNFNMNNAT